MTHTIRDKYVSYVGTIREVDHGDWTSRHFLATDTGKTFSHDECRRRAEQGERALTRWFSRAMATVASGDGMDEHDLERLEWFLDNISTWLESAQQALDGRRGVQRQEERIKALRNVSGRTPEEAAAFLAKAAQLEGSG
jgi:hypothetical protein